MLPYATFVCSNVISASIRISDVSDAVTDKTMNRVNRSPTRIRRNHRRKLALELSIKSLPWFLTFSLRGALGAKPSKSHNAKQGLKFDAKMKIRDREAMRGQDLPKMALDASSNNIT